MFLIGTALAFASLLFLLVCFLLGCLIIVRAVRGLWRAMTGLGHRA